VNELTKIGYISNYFALKGEMILKVKIYETEKILKNKEIYIDDKLYKINNYRPYKGNYIIKLDGFNHINEIQSFIHKDVYINKKDFIIENLIGYTIKQDGKTIGIVKDILKTNIFILEVEPHMFIPYVDEYVIEVDDDKKEILCKNVDKLKV